MLVFWQWMSASACAAGTTVRETPCSADFQPSPNAVCSFVEKKTTTENQFTYTQKIMFKRGTILRP